jgi:hypothetical protein
LNTRSRDASNRFAERRKREDEAPRLRTAVPRLDTLRLEVEEHPGASSIGGTKHVRLIVVEHAPALFLMPCGDPGCRDGGHDVTSPILRALRDRNPRFQGDDTCAGHVLTDSMLRHLRQGEPKFTVDDVCSGSIGTAVCGRVVHVTGVATYSDTPAV